MTRALEKSFGIIPLRQINEEWEVLIVKHRDGHWGFPKGRAEEGESPLDTAKRELREETGLEAVELLDQKPWEENYIFRRDDTVIYKLVDLYLATVSGILNCDKDEIIDAEWVNVASVKDRMQFREAKKLCIELEKKFKKPEQEKKANPQGANVSLPSFDVRYW